jgi:hypothetical protein
MTLHTPDHVGAADRPCKPISQTGTVNSVHLLRMRQNPERRQGTCEPTSSLNT